MKPSAIRSSGGTVKRKEKAVFNTLKSTETPKSCDEGIGDINLADHSYTFEKDLPRMSDMDDTPEKPRSKEMKDEPSLLEMQENIITLLSKKINESSGNLENLIRENTPSIGTLKKSIDFALNEVKDLKGCERNHHVT
ncbi:hypothetical protein ROHU_003894 [Labeo rohita]|uniref:Uncharacterized protein n=1 Tax=Labeo rohita TaxID=84645 RepID=A0A498NSF5_LABRO|nr:hypothetical protein ROHU_003894 [Labeo rohita]